MTNKDKYLKDGVDVEELCKKIAKAFFGTYDENDIVMLEEIFNTEVKPTLTEDEKVILRNIQPAYEKIKRYGCDLYVLYNNGTCSDDIPLPFNHLFQFIKPGEEYSIKELLGDE